MWAIQAGRSQPGQIPAIGHTCFCSSIFGLLVLDFVLCCHGCTPEKIFPDHLDTNTQRKLQAKQEIACAELALAWSSSPLAQLQGLGLGMFSPASLLI